MFEDKINHYADKHGIPRDLAMRQVAQESSFNPNAVSKVGAAGLLQLMPGTAADLGLTDADRFDPDKNLDAGFKYLAQQYKTSKGNWGLALAAYNAGPANVRKYNGIPPFAETQEYVKKILNGKNAPATATTPQLNSTGLPIQGGVEAPVKQTALEKKLGKLATLSNMPVSQASTADTTLQDSQVITDAINRQNLVGLESGTATAGEAFEQGFQDNVTGALWDAFSSGEVDYQFNERLAAGEMNDALDAQSWGSDSSLRGYVLASNNEADFERRVAVATERAEFSQKMQNTGNWTGFGVGASQFVGNMADPVAILTSFGLGGLGGSLLKGTALGATENIVAGIAVDSLQNKDTSVAEVLLNGSMGAVLGGIGGTFEHRSATRAMDVAELSRMNQLLAEADATQARLEAGGTLEAIDADVALREAGVSPLEQGEADYSAGSSTSYQQSGSTRNTKRDPTRFTIRSDNPFPDDANSFGYDTNPATNGVALSDDPAYRKLGNHGTVREVNNVSDLLRVSPEARELGIAHDAKAVYLPAEDRVYMIRGNIPEGTDMRGLIMHETGVHYGLERFVGGQRFNEIMDVVAKSDDPRMRAARAAVPEDTPMHLRMEEALGYYVENNPTQSLAKRIVSILRNALRENIPLFNRMKMTEADVLEYVRGSVKRAAKAGRVSRDVIGFVWHGGPVKGIDQLDTAFIGTGEGNQGFGWGLYTSSARNTAERYRRTETRKRGMRTEDGGLYQLRLLADQRDMISWEGVVADTHAAQNLKGDLAPMAGETGEVYLARMADVFGSKKAAAEALDEAGVPGITHYTGDSRNRNNGWRDNNFVLFHNRHLDMAARYSRPQMPNATPTALKATIKENNFNAKADVWDDAPTAVDKERRGKLSAWYNSQRPEALNDNTRIIDSPGLILQMSQSKRARYWGAHILEDSTGLGLRVNDTASMVAATTADRWKHAYIPDIQSSMQAMMNTGERVGYAFGSQKGMLRISREVAIERLERREAIKQGGTYTSTASQQVQDLATKMDTFYAKVLGEATTAGVPRAAMSLNTPGKSVGFMPYRWDYQELNRLRVEDPAKYNNIVFLMKQQYRDNILTPVLDALAAQGPIDPAGLQALLTRVTQRVEHLVSVKMKRLMDDPESRVRSNDADLSNIAEELLAEKYHGDVVTLQMADDFKRALSDILSDTSRTEMNLVAEANGTRLLDVIQHDAIGQVESTIHQYSGLKGLAKHGVKEQVDVDSILDTLRADGATVAEIEALDFGFRSLGLGSLKNGKEAKWATALRDGAHMTMMGRLSFSLLAELPMIASTLGLAAVTRSIPRAMHNSPLMQQLAKISPGLAGLEHRLNTLSGVELGQREQGTTTINNLLRRGRQTTDYISAANAINTGMHRAFVPMAIHQMVEGLLRKGGLSPEQLSDIGLSKELADRIAVQAGIHDANYKVGAELNIEKWGQYEGDQFLLAANRLVSQIMTRAHIGERPMWQLESDMGQLFVQFKGAGYVAAEKQLMRTVATNGSGALLLKGSMALMWGAMLYEAKLASSTAGMTDKQKKAYLDEWDTPRARATGTLIYTNMSGLMPDASNITQMLLGGNAQGSSVVAGLGFLGKVQDLASAPVDLVQGDVQKAAIKGLKAMPGANSVPMLYILNTMKSDD